MIKCEYAYDHSCVCKFDCLCMCLCYCSSVYYCIFEHEDSVLGSGTVIMSDSLIYKSVHLISHKYRKSH